MRRKPKLNTAKKIWPLFLWKRCWHCGIDFRKEWGWKKVFSLPYPLPNNNTRYLCNTCAPDVSTANIIFSRFIKKLINHR